MECRGGMSWWYVVHGMLWWYVVVECRVWNVVHGMSWWNVQTNGRSSLQKRQFNHHRIQKFRSSLNFQLCPNFPKGLRHIARPNRMV